MSRSGYSDDWDGDGLPPEFYRRAVRSAIQGKRGQAFLREMAAAMDAMPEKRLIAHELEKDGEVCAIGTVGRARGVDQSKLDPEAPWDIAAAFGIAECLVKEIEFENDDDFCYARSHETPEERWARMRLWVANRIFDEPTAKATP